VINRKLREMKLDGMAAGFEEFLARAQSHEMTPLLAGAVDSAAKTGIVNAPIGPS
jgi:hypothetical protein